MKLGGSQLVPTLVVGGVLGTAGALLTLLVARGHSSGRQSPSEPPRPEPPTIGASPAPHRAVLPTPALPETLSGTGLYADFDARAVDANNRPFTPQYPLWSDGARKRRWIRLPKGSVIDASRPDAWQFPVGTKLWKEFSFDRPVETRFIERTPSGWRFAAYVWSEDGRTATLAPDRGAIAGGEIAPGVSHRIPSSGDCRVCHGNGATPVLGFSAIQLSADRDPNAVHREAVPSGALDLEALVAGGWLRDFSGSTSPRIAARAPTERAALGYLHANCGACHRSDGPLASLDMVLASSIAPGAASGAAIETHGRSPEPRRSQANAHRAPRAEAKPARRPHALALGDHADAAARDAARRRRGRPLDDDVD